MLPTPVQWAPASGRGRWAALVLSILLFGILVLGARQTIRAPYDGVVKKEWLVARVAPGSPAEEAGLKPGDRLLGYSPSDLPPAPGRTRTYRVERDRKVLELPLTFTELPTHELARRLSKTGLSLFFLAIGLVVFLRRSDKTGTLFFLTCFLFGGVFAVSSPMIGTRLFLFSKMFYNVCVLLLPAVFLHFFLIFPETKRFLLRRPRIEVWLYIPALAMLSASLILDLMIIRRKGIGQTALTFQDLGSVVITVYYLLGFLSFVHSFRSQHSPAMKRRLRYVLAGTLLGAGPLVVLSLILTINPSISIPGFRYSFLTLLLIPFSFAHAIVKYRLMDLDIIVRRSVAYTLLTAALVAIYVGLVQGLGVYLLHQRGHLTLVLSVVSIFIIALVFSTLRDRIQRLVDRVFYMGRYSFPDTLREFGRLLASPIPHSQILDRFVEQLADVLKVEHVLVFLPEPVIHNFVVRAEAGQLDSAASHAVFESRWKIVEWLQDDQIPLPLERLRNHFRFQSLPPEERDLLDRMGSALLAPVISGGLLVAILSVGHRRSHEPLSRQDLALIEAVASQTAQSLQAASLREEKGAREKMQRELEIAREIQKQLLPKSAPRFAGVTVGGMNIPCHEVGGDFYDYILLDDHRLGLAIADVCGKGVSAALLMAALQAAFRAEAETRMPPAFVLERVNRRLMESFGPERFASLFYGIVDLHTMKLHYASAGHDPPLLLRSSGQMEVLESTGTLLGITDEARYIDREILVDSGDFLLLYTDGVTEELNEDEETFGRIRLQSLVGSLENESPEEVASRIYDAVLQFTMGSIQDDVTLVTLRFD